MKYDRHSTVAVNFVLGLIEKHWEAEREGKTIPRPSINGVPRLGVSSLRMRTFLVCGPTCVECGLKATYFAIERDLATARKNGDYHLNLYADTDGGPMLFTHDHTHARGLGGSDHLSNTTTMCAKCNFKKSRLESKLVNALRKKEEERDKEHEKAVLAQLDLDETDITVR